MSTETPRSPDDRHPQHDDRREADDRCVVSRVEAWLAPPSSADAPDPPEALDTHPRRWDVVDPSATRIGYPDDPADDLDERLRDLHAERHADMRGNERRRRQLDVARVTQAVCNSLDLTAWERDRVLGVVCELDLDTVESRHAVSRVALVVARHVVDAERGEASDRSPVDPEFTPAAVDRLTELLADELDDRTLEEAVFGRSPYRDPCLPAFERYAPDPGNDRPNRPPASDT